MKTCLRCAEAKPLDAFGRNKRNADGLQPWCTPCRAAHRAATSDARSAYQRDYIKGHTITAPCQVCGTPFTARKRTPLVKTCPRAECRTHRSRESAVAARRRSARTRLARAAEGVRSGRVWQSGACAECGVSFVGQTRGGMPLCSPACKDRVKKAKRRASKRQTQYEPVSRLAVLRRDDHTCYLCAVPLTSWDAVRGWVPTLATIDHVVPLAKGGAHTLSNLRACCAGCNSTKSDRLDP